MTAFLSEVKGICDSKPSKVRVLYWDTQVCRDEVYEIDKLDDLPQSQSQVEVVAQKSSAFKVHGRAWYQTTSDYRTNRWLLGWFVGNGLALRCG